MLPLAWLREQPLPAQPLRVWAEDESRFGRMTIGRRRVTQRGVKPLLVCQQEREYLYLYGSIAPVSGESFFLELPALDASLFQLYLEQFAARQSHWLNLLVLDNAPAHVAKWVQPPANVRFIFTPPYTPEVNPMERFWEDLKDKLAGFNAPSLSHLSDELCRLIQGYPDLKLSSLTSYPFFQNVANGIGSL